jgi:hypothetical protein
MLRVVVCVAVLASGCAFDPQPVQRTTTKFKTRTCTVTMRAMTKEEFCATPQECPWIATCGEAYYRFTTCGEIIRDGNRNGVPCENRCGHTPLDMAAKIRSEPPFSPPLIRVKTCNPA